MKQVMPPKKSAAQSAKALKEFAKDTQAEIGGNENMTVGNLRTSSYPGVKTSGIQVRGGKAQTKGKMARGPMA